MAKTDKQVISGYHRPVCKRCNCEFRPERNGVGVLDMYRPSDGDSLQPYELFDADLWKCPKCGVEVVGGFGISFISSHHSEGFQKHIDSYQTRGLLIINNG